jgi:hypothetical protein
MSIPVYGTYDAYRAAELAAGKPAPVLTESDINNYVSHALSVGITMGEIETFIRANPGDWTRMEAALIGGGIPGTNASGSTSYSSAYRPDSVTAAEGYREVRQLQSDSDQHPELTALESWQRYPRAPYSAENPLGATEGYQVPMGTLATVGPAGIQGYATGPTVGPTGLAYTGDPVNYATGAVGSRYGYPFSSDVSGAFGSPSYAGSYGAAGAPGPAGAPGAAFGGSGGLSTTTLLILAAVALGAVYMFTQKG